MKNYALYFFFLCSFLLSEPKEHQSLMATLFVQNSAESYTNSLSIYKAAEDQLEKVIENTKVSAAIEQTKSCLLYTSPSPRDGSISRMPSSA